MFTVTPEVVITLPASCSNEEEWTSDCRETQLISQESRVHVLFTSISPECISQELLGGISPKSVQTSNLTQFHFISNLYLSRLYPIEIIDPFFKGDLLK